MNYLLLIFQAVSIIFALSAVAAGLQSILDPVAFSNFFGLSLNHHPPTSAAQPNPDNTAPLTSQRGQQQRALTTSYIALMGVRQLATGVILLVFAVQGKWIEVATVLNHRSAGSGHRWSVLVSCRVQRGGSVACYSWGSHQWSG